LTLAVFVEYVAFSNVPICHYWASDRRTRILTIDLYWLRRVLTIPFKVVAWPTAFVYKVIGSLLPPPQVTVHRPIALAVVHGIERVLCENPPWEIVLFEIVCNSLLW